MSSSSAPLVVLVLMMLALPGLGAQVDDQDLFQVAGASLDARVRPVTLLTLHDTDDFTMDFTRCHLESWTGDGATSSGNSSALVHPVT